MLGVWIQYVAGLGGREDPAGWGDVMVREGHGCDQEWRRYGGEGGAEWVVVSLETEENHFPI